MNHRSLASLIVINAVLLAALVVTVSSPAPAQAQLGGIGGQYMMIAGNVTGREAQAAVYIIDMRTSNVIAVMFNGSNNTLEFVAGRDISQDAARATQRR
jgi:hypothetical protein